MHDYITLVQVLVTLVTGLFTLWLSNKKNNHDYLKDENERLNARVIRLTKRVDKLERENIRLSKEIEKQKGDGK